jgi:hypothetical protein
LDFFLFRSLFYFSKRREVKKRSNASSLRSPFPRLYFRYLARRRKQTASLAFALPFRLLFVNFFRVENAFADDDVIVALELTEEAARVTFVASGTADLVDLQEKRVAVAVDVNPVNLLDVAAFFAFAPQFVSAAAVVNGVTEFQRFFVAFLVHIRHHQDFAGFIILRDRGNEPVAFFEIRTDFIVAAAAGIAHFFFSFLLFARFASSFPPFWAKNVDAF